MKSIVLMDDALFKWIDNVGVDHYAEVLSRNPTAMRTWIKLWNGLTI
ncbi:MULTISPECIES: hypothetical protein [Lysinibacillus]|uniref:Uncharacterized protein n=1 Tax=Lysinibacillus capsici TaxID=2115968 RepID=A0ABY8KMS2_9BACI|nr:hypothetical protein [Lysinibacillus capsici]WGF40764.1 hypothetical protein QBO96_11130 [Lysinibacillus capsici]